MSGTVARETPWHLWVVGGLSLLWNGFSGYDYVMLQTHNHDYMRMMTEPYGYEAQAALDYFTGMPMWFDAVWALGVWGAIAGSVLLLLRSRFALHGFAVGLVGLAASAIYTVGNPMPGMTDSPIAIGFTAVIVAVMVLLIWYSRRQTAAGVLR